ncbi:MAG TPA: GntR family transcriptional regulator [Planctomycetota bacterium]|nr:GntR family transcriptional regulator [Planctomycetota bacterium]
MSLRIDPAAPEPLFEQIGQRVKESVAAGLMAPGDRLPSVRELARELAINPNTVARAYEALERDGVIVRRQGSGCFITEQASPLRDDERAKRLAEQARRLVTEAFHLGFDAADIESAVSSELDRVRFPERA